MSLDEINSWIQNWKKIINKNKKYRTRVVPRIVCNDGFSISIQASCGHYCTPRGDLNFERDDSEDAYSEFELGFPSKKEPLILNYKEENEHPTNTIYGWVPLEIVYKMIQKHKGIDYKKSIEAYAKG